MKKSAKQLIRRNIFIILKSLSLKYEKKMALKFRFSLMKSRFSTLKPKHSAHFFNKIEILKTL